MDRKTKVMTLCSAGLFVLAISLGVAWWALNYQANSGTDEPNAADWLQGWGTIYGLVVTSVGAVVAGLVYYETLKAARMAEIRRQEDRAEAQANAIATETRWREERAHREQQDREAELAAPRAVLVTRVAPSMGGFGEIRSVSITIHNFGALAVSRVNCLVSVKPSGAQTRLSAPVIGPAEEEVLHWHAGAMSSLTINKKEAEIWDLNEESSDWRVAMRFLDPSGQAWERVDNGEPVKVDTTSMTIVN